MFVVPILEKYGGDKKTTQHKEQINATPTHGNKFQTASVMQP
jgi:hypothetical protein